jgi:hypothetical protein
VATARAELAVQGGLALAVLVAFTVVHVQWWRSSRSGPAPSVDITVGGDPVGSIARRDPGGSV